MRRRWCAAAVGAVRKASAGNGAVLPYDADLLAAGFWLETALDLYREALEQE